jgi:hypothetical protein
MQATGLTATGRKPLLPPSTPFRSSRLPAALVSRQQEASVP